MPGALSARLECRRSAPARGAAQARATVLDSEVMRMRGRPHVRVHRMGSGPALIMVLALLAAVAMALVGLVMALAPCRRSAVAGRGPRAGLGANPAAPVPTARHERSAAEIIEVWAIV